MNRAYSKSRRPQQRYWLSRIMLVLGFVLFSMIGAIVSTSKISYADGTPGGDVTNPVVRAVDIAEPAVVRIITTVGGRLTVHFSATNNVTFPQNGSSYPLTLSGTGTFISAHGDILTADHVINPPHDQQLAQDLDGTAASDVAAYINQHSSTQVSADQVDQELVSGQLPSDPSYDPATSQVYLSTSYTGPLSAPDLSSVPFQFHAAVDRIEMQSSFTDTDVAIVHVAMNDMPSVQLGDSSNVQPQDQLTIIGFPGNGDVSNKPTDLLTPSVVNQIEVSSIKTTDSGAELIQVSGNVEPGDSGGPALDSNGQVVGIVSFRLASSDSPGATSFLQASDSARTLVQSLRLNTTPGPFEKSWSQAFNDYASTSAGHWHKAAQEFAQIAAKYPLFKAIQPYLSYAQTQAKTEKVPQSHPTTQARSSPVPAYVWAIVGILILLALIALLFGVFVWRRRRTRKQAAPISGGPITPPAQVPAPARIQAGQPAQSPPPAAVAQPRPFSPPAPAQPRQLSPDDDGMTAFGAPPKRVPPAGPSQPQSQSQGQPGPLSVISGTLRPWPCGHMNRPNARYCSICGEPAPPPSPVRKFEQ